jgi:hypothetical protein
MKKIGTIMSGGTPDLLSIDNDILKEYLIRAFFGGIL